VTLHFVTGEAAGEGLVIDLIPAAERDQQLCSYQVPEISDFLLGVMPQNLTWLRKSSAVFAWAINGRSTKEPVRTFEDPRRVGMCPSRLAAGSQETNGGSPLRES
jgi:hypothetical protein